MAAHTCNPSAGEMEARLVDTTLLAKFEAKEQTSGTLRNIRAGIHDLQGALLPTGDRSLFQTSFFRFTEQVPEEGFKKKKKKKKKKKAELLLVPSGRSSAYTEHRREPHNSTINSLSSQDTSPFASARRSLLAEAPFTNPSVAPSRTLPRLWHRVCESLRLKPKGEGPGSHLLSAWGSLSARVTRHKNTCRSTPRPHPAIPGCATKQSVHSAWRAPEAGAVGARRLLLAPSPCSRPGSATTTLSNSATETPGLQERATPHSAHARRASSPRRARGRAGASHLAALSPGPTRAGCAPRRYLGATGWSGPGVHSGSAAVFSTPLAAPACATEAAPVRSFVVSHAERGWERAGRAAVAGGRRCAQRGRGAAAASASRAGRAPDGRRRRRGLGAGDRVGPGGGSPRAAPANRVAGFRARSLARRHAHTRGRSGEGAEPAERQIPARCESPGQVFFFVMTAVP
eukprot:XP_017448572.1 PREDICTED: uncharacterized protein LOC108350812 [Rattus norvegicus]